MDGIVFYKMSGSGNDFIMLDGRHLDPGFLTEDRARTLCDRRLGVGADGLVLLTPDAPGDVRMDFWNCDGSRADMCGNAALCSTRLSAHLEMAPASGMRLVTRAGTFPVRCRPGAGELAELNLPDFVLPATPPGLDPGPGEAPGSLATVGVPHLVVEVADLERPDLMDRGRVLRFHSLLGPAGANVNFVAPREGRWCVRTYERGVEAETLACGTGAVAAAVALVQSRKASFPVELVTRSGRILTITATLSAGRATKVWLIGEGRLVFTGVLSGPST